CYTAPPPPAPAPLSLHDALPIYDEVNRAVIERARSMPGREKEVWDYYRNNANALAQLRAPIYEDKVVDFILELATVTEKKVSREDRKSTRLNSIHDQISYAVFCL